MIVLAAATTLLLVLATSTSTSAGRPTRGLRALQSTPLVDCTTREDETSCTTDPTNGEFCVWQDDDDSCVLSRPTCPLLTESECTSGRNSELCRWDSSGGTGCDYASDDMWGTALYKETKWHGYIEFGQTHVFRAVHETRHAPRLIADREAEMLFTPTLEAQPTTSPTPSPTNQIVHDYGLEHLGTVEVKNANGTAGGGWPDGYPKSTTNLLDDDQGTTYYIPNDVPDVDIEFDLAGQRRVQGVYLKTWYVSDIRDAIEVGLAPDDGCDESVCAMPAEGWTWIDAGSIPNGYNTDKVIHVPKLRARYVRIRLRGGWSSYGSKWGLRRLHISGDVDGEADQPDSNSTSSNLETGIADGRAHIPSTDDEVRIAAHDADGRFLGVHVARDPMTLRPILEQAVTADRTLEPYSSEAWSSTLPWNWIREGTELLIGSVHNQDMMAHRITLGGLKAWSEHTLIRTKVVIFGTAEEAAALDTTTNPADMLATGMFNAMPVSQLKWVDPETWYLPYIVQGTSDGPKLVRTEQERRDARDAAGDDMGNPGTEPGWDILKDQLAKRMNCANTGRGFSGTINGYGAGSPYADGTRILMGWAQSVEKDVDGDGNTTWVYEDMGSWNGFGGAASKGWCGMPPRKSSECGNLLIHELGHSQTMSHFTTNTSRKWGIEEEYPLDGTNMPWHPWGYDTTSRRYRTWYYPDTGLGKRDPMNGGKYVTSESCFPQYTAYHAKKSQNWGNDRPLLLSAETSHEVSEDGVYLYSEVTKKYERLEGGAELRDKTEDYCMPPVRISVPVVVHIGTLGRDDEACQTYPGLRMSSGNTFEMPDPLSPDLPLFNDNDEDEPIYEGASYYVEVFFADGTSEKGLIAVPNLKANNSTELRYYSFNLDVERRPTRVDLYRYLTDSYPFLTVDSAAELLHQRDIILPADVATNPLKGIPATHRVGRSWMGQSGDVLLNDLCISDEDCSNGGSTKLHWRGRGADLTYGSSVPADGATSTSAATVLEVPVVRVEDGSSHTVKVAASRFFEEDGGELASVFGSPPSSAQMVPPDATHGVILRVPDSLNSHIGWGSYRTVAPVELWADDDLEGGRFSNLRITVEIDIHETAETIDLSPTLQYVSDTEILAQSSSVYFLAADPNVGPTQEGEGGNPSTLMVPLFSSCPGDDETIIASIQAQQTACGSTWQMNEGEDDLECSHRLVLQLDDVTRNPWLAQSRDCTFETHPRGPVVLNAHRHHAPDAGSILDTLALQFKVTDRDPHIYSDNLQRLGNAVAKTATGEAWPDPSRQDISGVLDDDTSAEGFPNAVPDADLEFDLVEQRLIRAVYIYFWYQTDVRDSIEVGIAPDDGCVIDCGMPEESGAWTWYDGGNIPNGYNTKRTVDIPNVPGRYVTVRLRGAISTYGTNWGLRQLKINGDFVTTLSDITEAPTQSPTNSPTLSPSVSPTTSAPTVQPSPSPTTQEPSHSPTASPTPNPTAQPTASPSKSPTVSPTTSPTGTPTASPTTPAPTTTSPTPSPSRSPTASPTVAPTLRPTTSPTTLYSEDLQQLGTLEVKTATGEAWPDGFPRDTYRLIGDNDDAYYFPNTVPNVDLEFDLEKQRLIRSVYIYTWYQTDINDSIEVGLANDDDCVVDCTLPEDGWTWFDFGAFPNAYNSKRTVEINAPARYVRIRLRGGISSYKTNWGLRRLRIYGDVSTTLEGITEAPTQSPTSSSPTASPSKSPTASPTTSPTETPTASPTTSPTVTPTASPTTPAPTTTSPTPSPSKSPTLSPSRSPTLHPTVSPTVSPTKAPTTSPTTLYSEDLQQLGTLEVKTATGEAWPDGFPRDTYKLIGDNDHAYYFPNAVPDVDLEFDLERQRMIRSVYIYTWYVTDINDSIEVGFASDDGCEGGACGMPVSGWTWHDFGAFPSAYNSKRTVDIVPNVAARYVKIRIRGGISSYKTNWGLRRLRIMGDVHA